MEFRVLGPLEVRQRGRALKLGGAQQRALLAILLTQANRVATTERIAELLWGAHPPDTAPHTIAVHVSNLRRVLEPRGAPYRVLVRRDSGYRLEVGAEDLDASRFASLVEGARQLPLDKKAAQLSKALSLWRGPAYADFSSQSFALGEAARLNELRMQALEERIETELDLDRHSQLIGELESLVSEHPLRERLAGQLMLALYRSGRQAEASAVYQKTRHRLVDELGMEPGPQLQSLLTRILKHDPGLGPSAESIDAPRFDLPVQLTSFVGRRTELGEVGQLVREFQMVTLTGTAGSGKTRLAIEVGANLRDRFSDGVWFVDLSAMAEGDFVVPAIGAVLGIGEQAGRGLLSTLADHLQTQIAVLILDNCEQVLDSVAHTAQALVTRCPGLHVLATSREPLRVDGEHIHQLPLLSLPGADSLVELEGSEAVQLFLERARLSVPSFAITDQNASSVGELCRRLDGIPLAIELAAARVSSMSPDEILARLSDEFGILATDFRTRSPRQRSLRAALDWSYRLLEPAEATLFRRLSVFSGGFYLSGAEQICGGGFVKPADIAGLLSRLCDRSLVVPHFRPDSATRYRCLDTVRAFSAGRLKDSGEERAQRGRHAAFYLQQFTGAREGIGGADAQRWLDTMEIEHDNARSALSWAVEADRNLALQLATAWEPFWMLRGHVSEGRRWLSAVLDGLEGEHDWNENPGSAYLLAEAKQAASRLAFRLGEDDTAQTYAQEALQIGRALRDKGITAALLGDLGGMAALRGDIARAKSCFEQSLADLREGERITRVPGFASVGALEAMENLTLAQALTRSGDYSGARICFERGLEYAQRAGGRPLVSISIGLGELALVDRDLRLARDHLASALELADRLGDQLGVGVCLLYCAGLAAASGKPIAAMRLVGAASKMRDALGFAPAAHSSDRTVKPGLEMVYRRLGRRAAENESDIGRAMSTREAVEYAYSEVLAGEVRIR